MEQALQKLTELIATINKELPEGKDLKNFLGISKELITDSLLLADAQLIALKEYDNHFETIFLKRELDDLFKKTNLLLNEKFVKLKNHDFNNFLRTIARIKFVIRETYISVVSDGPLRTEAAIIKAKEELTALESDAATIKNISTELTAASSAATAAITASQKSIEGQATASMTKIVTAESGIATIHSEVQQLKDSTTGMITDLQEKQKTSLENEQKIKEFLATVEAHKTTVESIATNTSSWNKEITKVREDIKVSADAYNAVNTKFKAANAELEKAYIKLLGKDDEGSVTKGYQQEIEELKEAAVLFIEDQQIKYKAQYDHIESLLPGATSAGLAEAYEKQKRSYKWPIRIWSIVFIAVISLMTGWSVYLFYQQFIKPAQLATDKETLTHGLMALLKDLPFFIPTIWLAVFASKQQSQYKRLQEEYSFKEINAKSFSGHKRQIEELMKTGATDHELLLKLIAQLVVITSQNPSATLDNKTHNDSPPLFKLVQDLLGTGKEKKTTIVKTEE